MAYNSYCLLFAFKIFVPVSASTTVGLAPECLHIARSGDALSHQDASWHEKQLAIQISKVDYTIALACAQNLSNVDLSYAPVAAVALEQFANHPQCLAEFSTKSAFEDRCTQKWYKIAIGLLLAAQERELATAMWKRAIATKGPSGSAGSLIMWPSILQTPTLWVPGLRSAPFWDCGAWPFMHKLQSLAPEILQEIRSITPSFGAAYPYLKQQGSWQTLFLLRGRQWNQSLCNAMPLTCRVLLPELPTKPGVPFCTRYNEEVVIFRSMPDTVVIPHSGASNNVISLHLTLTGAKGTFLSVGDEAPQKLQDGRALCFQDSFLHSIQHQKGGAERISIVIRVMHPDASREMYGNAMRTDAEDLNDWNRASSLKDEVERMRSAYRQLAESGLSSPSSSDCSCNSTVPYPGQSYVL